MPRWKKPTKEETTELRRRLAERAAAGDLRLPQAVSEMRRALGLNQKQFSELTGITRRQVAEIETGKANPTVDTVAKIGRLFGFALGFVPKPRLDSPAEDHK